MRLFDSELKIMELLWAQGNMTAKELAEKLSLTVGWNKNTTYTVLKKLVEKALLNGQIQDFTAKHWLQKTKSEKCRN